MPADTRVEKLVDFWTTHFSVGGDADVEAALQIAAFESAGLTVTDTTPHVHHVERERQTQHEVDWAGFGGFLD
jgi:hypothetical protein